MLLKGSNCEKYQHHTIQFGSTPLSLHAESSVTMFLQSDSFSQPQFFIFILEATTTTIIIRDLKSFDRLYKMALADVSVDNACENLITHHALPCSGMKPWIYQALNKCHYASDTSTFTKICSNLLFAKIS